MINNADNMRDQAILIILSDAGCRVSELLAVTPNDFDFDRQAILIPHLKRGIKKQCPHCHQAAGKATKYCSGCGADISSVSPVGTMEKTRMISIGGFAADKLNEYIRAAKIGSDDRVFPISRQMVYKIVRDAAETIGLKGKCFLNTQTNKRHYVHPHDLRTALAVSWLDVAKGDANKQKALQSHLGHQSFVTTMRYSKISPAEVKSVGDEVRKARFG